MKALRTALALVVALVAVGTVGTGQTPAPVSDRAPARASIAGVSVAYAASSGGASLFCICSSFCWR